MSHHYSGPRFGFPHGDAGLDLTDLFAFPKLGDARKSILILNVHPSVSFDPRGPTMFEPFSANAFYEFKMYNNGDAVADLGYRVRLAPCTGGMQPAPLRNVEGAQAAGTGDDGR